MAYLKPPWFTRAVFNKVAMATGMSNTQKLTVTRRRSKQRPEVPVITVDVGGTKSGVHARRIQWVKNLRVDPTRRSGPTAYVARNPDKTARVLTAYREKTGRAVEGFRGCLARPTTRCSSSLPGLNHYTL
jgi:hypothetical protein